MKSPLVINKRTLRNSIYSPIDTKPKEPTEKEVKSQIIIDEVIDIPTTSYHRNRTTKPKSSEESSTDLFLSPAKVRKNTVTPIIKYAKDQHSLVNNHLTVYGFPASMIDRVTSMFGSSVVINNIVQGTGNFHIIRFSNKVDLSVALAYHGSIVFETDRKDLGKFILGIHPTKLHEVTESYIEKLRIERDESFQKQRSHDIYSTPRKKQKVDQTLNVVSPLNLSRKCNLIYVDDLDDIPSKKSFCNIFFPKD